MLTVFSFRAKPGKEKALESLLSDEETTRRIAESLGQERNALFLKEGRMIRVVEMPEGADPPDLAALAREEAWFHDMLEELGEIVEDPFDVDDEESLRAFGERVTFPQVFDIQV